MLQVLTPESTKIELYPKRLFLAGSIEQGKAIDWQTEVALAFVDTSLTIYNPRRSKWNPDLEQTMLCDEFREQVIWEQRCLAKSGYVLMNFVEDTKSPISLLELGQLTRMEETTTVVVCPRNFWRRGNVEIMCALNGLPLYDTLAGGIAHLKMLLK